jgi:outer membrane protein assembly factor BamB
MAAIRAGANDAPQDGRQSILAAEEEPHAEPGICARAITVPPSVAVTDWSQPGGTADNSPPQSSGTAILERAWRANLGAGSNNRSQIAAPPVIANGSSTFLDADHRVHAIDARDGHRLWDERLRPREGRDRVARGGGVAVGGGRVYVTTGFGFIVALDAATATKFGARKPCAVPIGADRSPGDASTPSPTIAN